MREKKRKNGRTERKKKELITKQSSSLTTPKIQEHAQRRNKRKG